MEIINVTDEIIEINVTEEVVTIQAPTGAYPLPNAVNSVFGRVGNIIATEGDYTLTQLGDVTLTSPANGQVLKYNGTQWVNSTDADTGITTLNTLTALSQTFATGTSGTDFNISSASSTHTFNFPSASATNRGLLTSADWSNFNTAYNDSITSAAVTGTTTKTLTLNQQDGGTITASWTDINTDAVTSVFGRTGAVTAQSGDYTTTQVTEGTNLYFTDARARAAITLTTTGTSGAATYSGGTLNIPQYQGVLTNPVTGTGTTNTLPKFTGTSAIGNSNITDTGSLITLGSTSYVNGNLAVGSNATASGTLHVQRTTDGNMAIFRGTSNAQLILSISSSNLTYDSSNGGAHHVFQTNGTERFRIDSNGGIGIGSTSLSGFNLRISKNLTGAVNAFSLYQDTTIQSDVTAHAQIFRSDPSTAASAFTLSQLSHFNTNGSTLGAGSSITTQNGYFVGSNFIQGTNNYGFRGSIPSGTNRWNLYMDGTAANYLAGDTSIGTTTGGYKLNVNGTTNLNGLLTGTNTVFSSTVANGNTIAWFDNNNTTTDQSFGLLVDAGTSVNDYALRVRNAAASELFKIAGNGAATFSSSVTAASFIPTSSTIPTNGMYLSGTNTLGFATNSTLDMVLNEAGTLGLGLTPASNWGRTGFEIGVSGASITREVRDLVLLSNSIWTSSGLVYAATAGAGRFDVGVSGFRWYTAPSGTGGNAITFTQAMTLTSAGSLGIGTTNLPGQQNLRVSRNISGSTIAVGILNEGITQSDVTNFSIMYTSTAQTAAAAFTLSNMVHYYAQQAALGAGSAITTQSGFWAESNLIGATNNYGFRGSIPAAANRWNIYMDGTANNYMAGSLGIGSTSLSNRTLHIGKTITGGTVAFAVLSNGVVQSDVTSQANNFTSVLTTAAAAFSLPTYYHFIASQGTIGSTSAVTNQYGFAVENTLIGATNNFGFWGNIPSGTNRWNLYMAGTAANYMAGNLRIGTTTTDGTSLLEVAGNVNFNGSGSRTVSITRDSGSTLQLQSSVTATGSFIFTSTNGPLNLGANNTNNFVTITTSGQLGVNSTSPNASARLQVDSTTQGFLPPRMTTTQKLAIGTPAAGLMVYDTTLNQMSYFNGTLWINF